MKEGYSFRISAWSLKQDMYGKCSKTDLIINSGSGLASKILRITRLCSYLNFTLFTFNKIRILIQYLVAKIGLVISWIR
ncbi:unnamed protein product [Rhizophagus irregularis]|nr:unnamed protein product [Rhizophagus irregularis]